MSVLPISALVVSVVLAAPAGPDAPPIFADVPMDQAIARTRDGGTLIVKATAVWCQPCKMMDKTTWVDEDVVTWFRRNDFTALQFDVDVDPRLAERLEIRSMPTMIAFRGGVEFDRISGYRDANGLIAWCAEIKAGRRDIDRLRAAARPKPGAPVNVQARMELAQALLRGGEFEKALAEYEWLWDHMGEHAPELGGVRYSPFFMRDIEMLVAESPAAREVFARKRDALAPDVDMPAPPFEELLGWLSLNRIIGDDAAILVWVDALFDKEHGPRILRRHAYAVDGVLIEHGRWKTLAQLHPDPKPMIARMAERFDDPLEEVPEAQRTTLRRGLRQSDGARLAPFYVAYLKTDQPELAETIVREMLARLPDGQAPFLTMLVDEASRHGVATPRMLELLDEAVEFEGADLPEIEAVRTRVKRMLAAPDAS